MDLASAAQHAEAFAQERLDVPGLTACLIGPGGFEHAFAVGVSDAASRAPMPVDALLPIASIGKAMTAVALLREVEQGRCGLDDAVHDWLPWLPLATPFGPIRLRNLLAHTAGIVEGLDATPSAVVDALALAGTVVSPGPGLRFHYSNAGYTLLGLVLERVAGCTYAEALERYVLAPCGMTGSEAGTSQEAQLRAPRGHLRLEDGQLVPAPWTWGDNGAGSTLCTARDLGRFLRALVANQPPLLGGALRAEQLRPALGLQDGQGYGLGVRIDVRDGYLRLGHSGHCPGFQSDAWGCPETGTGVVVLWNGPGSTWQLVAHALALLRAAVLGREAPPPPAPRPPASSPEDEPAPLALQPLTGTFASHNPWLPHVRIVGADGGLALVWPAGGREPLVELPEGGYRVGEDPLTPERLRFEALVEGRPWQLRLSGWPYDRVA